ncbi:TonB-dependent receptor plug domain-containing protein [Alteraurantiacibacter aestuarii]|uniref:TonB-dependent receptor n=1 Tax=Alteraurantiacibacter aestuarii TaxID=650004 RepID=A0A844ZKJ3_9SPHN|nr:TonB-dependent receptor [Alteraurantiacibacter aestuarii]MXO87782.1 TonB-dependent receptor [Alteraurantiacibacter aestuarii]
MACCAAPAHAQEADDEEAQEEGTSIVFADPAPDDMYAIVVNGRRTHVDDLDVPVSIIGIEEIYAVQGSDFTRILQRAPGVTFSRNGGPGGLTSLRIRGAEADQTLVLLDGVPINDVATPGGGYDFAAMLPAGISRIEIQRSSNSTVWGSRAMGGVVAMSTDHLWNEVPVSAEYGGPDSLTAQAAGGYYSSPFEASAKAAFLESGGISAAANGTEADALRQWQAGGQMRARIVDGLEMRASYRHADARADLDGFPAPDYQLADTNEHQRSKLGAGRAALTYWDDRLTITAAYSRSQTRRAIFDRDVGPDANFNSDGRSERVEIRGDWQLGGSGLYSADRTWLEFGAEQDRSRFATLFDAPASTASRAAFVQVGHRGEIFQVHAGVRREDHRDFGGVWNLGADASYSFAPDWQAKASYGEGFKAPSLFQLHSDYGNFALRPERSRSFDVSLQKGVQNFRTSMAVTLFRRESSDLIGFVSCFGESTGICTDRPFGTYDNTGLARAQGVEVEAETGVTQRVNARLAWAYIDTRDRTAGALYQGNRLARRPVHAGTLTLDWEAIGYEAFYLGADLRVVSASFDDPANSVRLGSYALVDLRAHWNVSEVFEIYGRIENIWDEQYQTAAGYGTQGRAAYIGVRVRL